MASDLKENFRRGERFLMPFTLTKPTAPSPETPFSTQKIFSELRKTREARKTQPGFPLTLHINPAFRKA
jgi:hypothetical protein